MNFEVSGKMNLKGVSRIFKRQVDAPNERVARERAYTDLGSRHKLPRERIIIEKVAKAVAKKKVV